MYRGFYFDLYDTLKPVLLGDDAFLLSFSLGYGVTGITRFFFLNVVLNSLHKHPRSKFILSVSEGRLTCKIMF